MKVVLFEELNLSLIVIGLRYYGQGCSVFYRSYKNGGLIINVIMGVGFLRKRVEEKIKPYTVARGIAERGDLYYRLQRWIVDTTTKFFETNNVVNDPVLKLFRWYYHAGNKADVYAKRLIQMELYEFVKWFAPFSEEGVAEKDFYYQSGALKEFILKEWKKQFGLSVHIHKKRKVTGNSLICLVQYYLNLLLRFHRFLPTITSRKTNLQFLFSPQFSIDEGLLSNDFFIGKGLIPASDVLFYFYGSEHKIVNPGTYEIIRRKGYRYAFIEDLKVPLSKIPWVIKERIVLPLLFFTREMFSKRQKYFVFKHVKRFYDVVDTSGIEKLLFHYNFNSILFQTTASLPPQVLPVFGRKNNFRTVIYPIGTTINRAVISDFAFQNADLALSWGNGLYPMYKDTSAISKIAFVGFTGKEYLKKSLQNKKRLYDLFPQINRSLPTITFYNVPYFPHHGGISTETFSRYYAALLECAQWSDVNVVLRVKNPLDPARFPENMREIFKNIASRIEKENIIVLDRGSIDPMDCIAISDINISVELSSPSTLALLCNKVGLFYNVVNNDLMKHCLFPKYLGSLIFSDTEVMLKKARQYLDQQLVADDLLDRKDLDPYDSYMEMSSIERFCQELYQ